MSFNFKSALFINLCVSCLTASLVFMLGDY